MAMPSSQRQINGTATKRPSNREVSVNVLSAMRLRYNGRSSMQQTELETAQYSMELLRQNVQQLFDKEIQTVVRKYMETYFEPALKNVKENLKNAGITDSYLQKVSCDLLENAKQNYSPLDEVKIEVKTEPKSIAETLAQNTNQFETISADELLFAYKTLPIKRKESVSPTSTEPPISNNQALTLNDIYINSPASPPPKTFAFIDQLNSRPTIQRPAPNIQIKTIAGPKPIIWNIASLTTETLFIFDFKANRALGYFDRERLINQHPELIRYLTDAQDKDWLIQQRLLSPSHRTYRILLFILEEVSKIAHTDEYRLRPNSKLNELTGFKVPEFMLQKMKNVFLKLGQKNQPLTGPLHGITMPGTYTVTTQPNPIKTIQTFKPILKPQLPPGTTTLSSLSSVLSSMRAGLQPTTVLLVDTSGNESKAYLTTADSTSMARKSLSSSHATLTALLSNSAVNDLTSTVATITELTDINSI